MLDDNVEWERANVNNTAQPTFNFLSETPSMDEMLDTFAPAFILWYFYQQ